MHKVVGSDGKPRHYHKFTPQEKVLGVLTFRDCHGSLADTTAALMDLWEGNAKHFPTYWATYCSGWKTRLEQTGSVRPLPRPGPPHKVPEAEAKEAAHRLMDGIEAEVLIEGQEPIKSRTHYLSYAEARQHDPHFQRLLDKYECTADTLLARMKEVCPNLAYGVQRVMADLSPHQKEMRQLTAGQLLMLPRSYFDRVIWVDETKVIVLGIAPKDVKVWRDKKCNEADSVVHVGGYKVKPVRIHVYVAVNAKLGLVGYWFSTGTTSLGEEWQRERFNVPGFDWSDNWSYLVRMEYYMNVMQP